EVRLPEVYSAEVHPPEVRLSERNEKSQSLSRSVRRPFATTPGARRSASLRVTPPTIPPLCPTSQSATKSPRVYPGVFAARSPPPRGRGMTADITKRERQYKPYARIGPVRTCAGGAQ